jgi:hypothetical protein
VTDEEVAARRDQFANSPTSVSDAAPIPREHPPFLGGLTDAAGNLWIWTLPTEGAPTWHVFAPDGRHITRVDLPSGFLPFEIGDDYILTLHWDEYHVEYVRLHRLEKGRG